MIDFVVNFLSGSGYLGVVALMVLEVVFPPIPSEVVLPFVGHLVAGGEMTLWGAIVASWVGAILGALFWFYVGWVLSYERVMIFLRKFGGYIAITTKDFDRSFAFFKKYEDWAVFFGRLVPTVRSLISIPAGTVKMSVWRFIFISSISILIWNVALILLGYWFLVDGELVDKYIKPISEGVIWLVIILYILQVVRFWREKRVDKEKEGKEEDVDKEEDKEKIKI